jgi:putative ABC transport system substrate-binding protein
MRFRPGLLLALFLGFTSLSPLLASVEAQPRGSVPRIGVLSAVTPGRSAPRDDRLRQGLRELGYVEGQNITIEWRYAAGRAERFAEIAAEFARLNVDVILAANNPAVAAALKATKAIPIVMVFGLDPVGLGFVATLARPGGTVTGLSSYLPELIAKRLQFLKEVVPNTSHVAVLWDSNLTGMDKLLDESRAVAQGLGVHLQLFDVRMPSEFEGAFEAMTRQSMQALLSLGSSMHSVQRSRIAELARRSRLPSVCNFREYVDAGCLMSYAPSFTGLWRHSAVYVDKILKGAKPADLPVEQPTEFELAINLKTAKALGLTIPPSLLLRADHVIE